MKKNKQNQNKPLEYNWFGIVPKSNKRKIVSYLGESLKKRKIPQTFSFLGTPNSNFRMNPPTLFKKESINQKRFSKWGDADLDGSPNYFDCDPTNFLKDAEEVKKKNIFKRLGGAAKKLGGAIVKGTRVIGGERLTRKEKKAAKEMDLAIERKKEFVKDLEATGAYEEKELEKMRKEISKRKGAEPGYQKFLLAAKIKGPAGAVKMKELAIEERLTAGKRPGQKQIQAYQKALEKTSLRERGKKFAEAVGIGGVTGVLGGYGLSKTKLGTVYSKAMTARAARVRKLTKEAAGFLISPSLTARGFSSEPRGRGRPSGPSGEYRIGGKPVYEEEFRQWEAKQNALNRMLPSEAQSQTLNPEYLEYMKARELEKKRQEAQLRFQQQTQQQQDQQMPQENEMMMEDAEEAINEPVPSDQSPITEGLSNEEIQAMAEAKIRPYTRSSPDEIREAQHLAQKQDQILNAPNFMKGELKAAGGSILTPTGPQIMDAPNVFTGEMRNVTSEGNMPAVRLSERPQTNPYGSEYLEIEIGSGKPVVRKRITEKWMSGEAL